MRRTGSVSVFWNTFIYQTMPELLELFWQIMRMRQVSSYSSLILSLLVDAGCSVGATASCDEDVGEVGEDELEELVGRPGETNGT